MNMLYSTVAATLLAANLVSPVRADDDAGRYMDPQKMEEKREKREEKMLERLTEKLKLTSEQQKSIKTVLDQQGDKAIALNKEYMDKRKALRDDTDSQITKFLTDDQKKQFETWKTEKHEHMKKRLDGRQKK